MITSLESRVTAIVASCSDICFCNNLQAPRTSRASLMKGRSQANAVATQALIAHWQSIVKSLNNYLTMMRSNNVRDNFLTHRLTCQIMGLKIF